MAGGIAPIDFWSVFNAAADSSHRKRMDEKQAAMQQQQFDMQKGQFEAETKARDMAARQKEAERKGLSDLFSGADPKGQEILAANPEAYATAIKSQGEMAAQQQAAQAQQQAAAQAKTLKEAQFKDFAAKVMMKNPGAAPKLQAMAQQQGLSLQLPGNALPEGMAGPQMQPTPDEVASLQQEAQAVPGAVPEPKTTGDIIDYERAKVDPAYARFLKEQTKARGTNINVGDGSQALTTKVAGLTQAQDLADQKSEAIIKRILEVSDGNPDKFSEFLNNAGDFATGVQKKLGGIAPAPSKERLADYNKQKQFDTLVAALQRVNKFTDEDGNEHDLTDQLTKGSGLGASLQALQQQIKDRQAINAEARGSGVAAVKQPRKAPKTAPPPEAHPPDFIARLKKEAAGGDAEAQAALKNLEAGGQ